MNFNTLIKNLFIRLSNKLSIKTKTIILLIVIISILSSIFFIIRLYGIRNFQQIIQKSKNKELNLIYKQSLSRIKNFYVARAYANLGSFGIEKALENKDAKTLRNLSLNRWKVIKKENPFLVTFSFYDANSKLLTFLGEKPKTKLDRSKEFKKFNELNNQNSYFSFYLNNSKSRFHIITKLKNKKNKKIGFIVFEFNAKYFLSELQKLTKLNVCMKYKSKKDQLCLDKNLSSSLYAYNIKTNNLKKTNSFKLIFYQDMSHWNNIIKRALLQSIIILIIISLLAISIINYGFELILEQLESTNKKLAKSQKELGDLNKNLQTRVKKEIALKLKKQEETRQKERLLLHQSKLASLGEMISHIAHQWRQPLNELSLIIISLELHFEKGKLDKTIFTNNIAQANKQIFYMSHTIDDFRTFFTSKKPKQDYTIKQALDLSLNILKATLENNSISLTLNIEDNFKLNGYLNEISQAILNILSNAKDMLLQRNIQNAKIYIKTFSTEKEYFLSINDNAGGIKISPISKIFMPYFSTKLSKNGTGLGLYMTKTIIEKNNQAKIIAKNNKKGANFLIIFPKNI